MVIFFPDYHEDEIGQEAYRASFAPKVTIWICHGFSTLENVTYLPFLSRPGQVGAKGQMWPARKAAKYER